MKRIFLIFIVLALLSCSETQFDVTSLSLRGSSEITIDAERTDRVDTLLLSASFSDAGESYTFRLSSPSAMLVWEGSMTGDDILSSGNIEITPGAYFPTGTYSVLFYSTNGTELDTTVEYNSDGNYPSFSDGVLTDSAYVDEYDGEGNLLREGERESGYTLPPDTASVRLENIDRFGNRISVSQSFQQEA